MSGGSVARMTYDEEAAAAYRRARELTPAALAEWCAEVGRCLPPVDGLPLLDVGAGTGVFAEAFARRFGVRVLAVEPSAAMREQARGRGLSDRVRLLGGEAERIPLAGASCGAAWLSTVIHHIGDLARCALELRRVLEPDSRVLIRSCFPGRHERINLFRFFPGARRVADTFPTVDATVAAFATAGFAFQALQPVAQISAPSLRPRWTGSDCAPTPPSSSCLTRNSPTVWRPWNGQPPPRRPPPRPTRPSLTNQPDRNDTAGAQREPGGVDGEPPGRQVRQPEPLSPARAPDKPYRCL